MLNADRRVPMTKYDALTIYYNMMKLAGTSVAKASASAPGVFALTSGSGNILADEPVKSLDFGASVTAAVVYFIADPNFKGFTIAGVAATPSGTVVKDGTTLMTATLSSGSITVAKVGA